MGSSKDEADEAKKIQIIKNYINLLFNILYFE